jgi:hypothetical protein
MQLKLMPEKAYANVFWCFLVHIKLFFVLSATREFTVDKMRSPIYDFKMFQVFHRSTAFCILSFFKKSLLVIKCWRNTNI